MVMYFGPLKYGSRQTNEHFRNYLFSFCLNIIAVDVAMAYAGAGNRTKPLEKIKLKKKIFADEM